MLKFLTDRISKLGNFHGNLKSLKVDVHSHLLPGLDDGVKSFDESLKIILSLQKMGYKKIITTPHVNSAYPNSNLVIMTALGTLKRHVKERGIDIELDAAAEYMLDSKLVEAIKAKKSLLTFAGKFLLFETSLSEKISRLEEFISTSVHHGYLPVLAHPERYPYIQNDLNLASQLFNLGVLFQLNIRSLSNGYSVKAQQTARKLIDRGLVHILGSDCHNVEQIKQIRKIQRETYFQEVLSRPLINETFLSYSINRGYSTTA